MVSALRSNIRMAGLRSCVLTETCPIDPDYLFARAANHQGTGWRCGPIFD